ncbi:integral membrane protein [Phlyctema vagabunda]|uniref:Integral membrane protein n=1 Tax=Phlyctema vagabunda TaxID=108571 RepID=A0ABR4PHH7_9HELO
MQLPPLDVLATWPTPNYINPVTRGSANTILNLILFPIVIFIVVLRVYSRTRLSKNFGADDALIVCAVLPTAGFMVLSLLGQLVYHGDRHVWDIHLDKLILGLKIELAAQVLFSAGSTLTKLSMLAMVKRIMSVSNGFMFKLVNYAMILVVVQASVFCIVTIFQCRPPSDYWTLSFKPQPNCIYRPAHLLVAGTINTFTDFLVVIIPIPTVYHLDLGTRQRAIVILLFAVGFLVSCAGVARTVYTYRFSTSYDQTWSSFPVWISSCVELYVGIICASVPHTRLFFLHYMPSVLGSSRTSNDSNYRPSHGAKILSDPSEAATQDDFVGMNRFVSIDDNEPRSTSKVERHSESVLLTTRTGTSYDLESQRKGPEIWKPS